ncbi:hypothetical protein M409DRAFT_26991 [Zasmidium cellare ATCC 36951]|uniref:Monooxygenase n=1 Tax=Zasmidium cellare ATCC 36951 TaxID=1080233 RepID=A0A6A6C7D3_ZASCE|nr:uncharacterized protein M409DRAFT_26991 [Zasmidium cellare ATCC 36951]KAF2162753.1 hypothetical protein M409DRAFT_26991 [Zasmidium cellare ATCC 36951]
MSRPGQDFKPLVAPQSERPRSRFFGPAAFESLLRDQASLSTWLCVGALVQGALILLVGRIALLPAAALILYRALDSYAMSVGWKRNTYMDGVLMKKFSAQIPDELGNYGNKPADTDVVVFLIGTRSNHPYGMLAPGFEQSGKYFSSLAQSLEDHAEEFGFLGMTSWLNSADRSSKSEIMQVCYFRNMEGLHAFAHSEDHRQAWDWWNRTVKQNPHLSIWHETYHVPKGHWENIYVNSHLSGITSLTSRFTDKETGQDMWASGVVDASKGLLKTSAGRMSRSKADDHDKYGEDPY